MKSDTWLYSERQAAAEQRFALDDSWAVGRMTGSSVRLTMIYKGIYKLKKMCIIINARLKYGAYGEVVNTSDCGSDTRRFDPCYAPQIDNKCFLKHFFYYKKKKFLEGTKKKNYVKE